MKMHKRLGIFLVILLVFAVAVFIGYRYSNNADAREVLQTELSLLKNPDTRTIQKYISYKELFPNATQNTELSENINEVFSLFFQNFDYRILDIQVDEEQKNATASVKLTTIDAQALAKDFAVALLKTQITEATQARSGSVKDSSLSLEGHYLILNDLLKNNTYDSVTSECTVQLVNKGSSKREHWEIQHSYSLENELVGNLIVYLSDPDILSPEDTLSIYLDTLKQMDLTQISSYLGVVSIMNTSDAAKNSIAEALITQIHANFDYKIKNCSRNGYNSTIVATITTFDSDTILENYQHRLSEYLNSAEAVIDGSARRYDKSLEFLLDSITENTTIRTTDVHFVLINDGVSWKLQDEGNTLGNAIFGNLAVSPLEEESE